MSSLILPEIVKLTSKKLDIDIKAAEKIVKQAFQRKDVNLTGNPAKALPYDDAKIDMSTGYVELSKLPKQPFLPTFEQKKVDAWIDNIQF